MRRKMILPVNWSCGLVLIPQYERGRVILCGRSYVTLQERFGPGDCGNTCCDICKEFEKRKIS